MGYFFLPLLVEQVEGEKDVPSAISISYSQFYNKLPFIGSFTIYEIILEIRNPLIAS